MATELQAAIASPIIGQEIPTEATARKIWLNQKLANLARLTMDESRKEMVSLIWGSKVRGLLSRRLRELPLDRLITVIINYQDPRYRKKRVILYCKNHNYLDQTEQYWLQSEYIQEINNTDNELREQDDRFRASLIGRFIYQISEGPYNPVDLFFYYLLINPLTLIGQLAGRTIKVLDDRIVKVLESAANRYLPQSKIIRGILLVALVVAEMRLGLHINIKGIKTFALLAGIIGATAFKILFDPRKEDSQRDASQQVQNQ
jgi:hypothetical protein